MKIAAKASYKAVPSILIVAPTGSTNLVTRLSTPFISSRHLNVTGSVAELKQTNKRKIMCDINSAKRKKEERHIEMTGEMVLS